MRSSYQYRPVIKLLARLLMVSGLEGNLNGFLDVDEQSHCLYYLHEAPSSLVQLSLRITQGQGQPAVGEANHSKKMEKTQNGTNCNNIILLPLQLATIIILTLRSLSRQTSRYNLLRHQNDSYLLTYNSTRILLLKLIKPR